MIKLRSTNCLLEEKIKDREREIGSLRQELVSIKTKAEILEKEVTILRRSDREMTIRELQNEIELMRTKNREKEHLFVQKENSYKYEIENTKRDAITYKEDTKEMYKKQIELEYLQTKLKDKEAEITAYRNKCHKKIYSVGKKAKARENELLKVQEQIKKEFVELKIENELLKKDAKSVIPISRQKNEVQSKEIEVIWKVVKKVRYLCKD